MSLSTQTFDQLVSAQIAAAQASAASLLDFSTGSTLLALVQANASAIGLWLQSMDIYLLAFARAATAVGPDLDSWMADFGLARLPATFANGLVTFARTNNTVQAVIPVGAIVQTANGAVSYTVDLDTANPDYSSALNGYVLTTGTSSIDVSVTATTAGTIGNAALDSINVINTPIPFIDSVNNASNFTNALAQETDTAFRARFVSYLASLSKATLSAIEFAISQVQGVVDFTVTENENYAGVTQYGYFYVVVDDGTGNPSDLLVGNVNNAVAEVVGLTILFGVYKPVIVNATVVMTVIAAPGYTHATIVPIVQTALTNYINTLPLGQTLYYTRLAQVAYDSTPGVLDVNSITLNSGTSDLTADAQHIIKLASLTIN